MASVSPGCTAAGAIGSRRQRSSRALGRLPPAGRVADHPDRCSAVRQTASRSRSSELGFDHQQPGAAVDQEVFDLRPHRRGVDRHRDRADPAAAEEQPRGTRRGCRTSAPRGRRAPTPAARSAPARRAATPAASRMRPARAGDRQQRTLAERVRLPLQHRRQRALRRRAAARASVVIVGASAEVGGLHARIAGQLLRRARQRDLAGLQHVAVVGALAARRARSARPAGSTRRPRAACARW